MNPIDVLRKRMNKKQRYLAIGGIAAFFAIIIIALLFTIPVYRSENVSVTVMQHLSDGRMLGTERREDDSVRYVLQDHDGGQAYITAEEYEDLKRTVGIVYRRTIPGETDSEPVRDGNAQNPPGVERES